MIGIPENSSHYTGGPKDAEARSVHLHEESELTLEAGHVSGITVINYCDVPL